MIKTIDRARLEQLIAADGVIVVDALPASYYEQMHLPGAVNLVEADVEELAPSLLPDREALVVTYCSNAACGNSKAVARKLEAAGYTNVHTYTDGIQDWVESGNATESVMPA